MNSFRLKTTTLPLINPISCARGRSVFLLILFALACFAPSPKARAVCQDGCDLSLANTFLGDEALVSDTNGEFNTAIGARALHNNTTGFLNTATGASALSENIYGNNNTATGDSALKENTGGEANTATGVGALNDNTIGSDNTANGVSALIRNKTGSGNTATGFLALGHNTTGNNNIALGFQAGFNLSTGNDNIDIGNLGMAGESKTVRIGKGGAQINTFIAGISGVTVPTGVAVIVDTTGHLGTTTSSARYKDNIRPMDNASEAILALKPVTFRYKHDLDPEGIPQFGLVAEDVEKVNPDLVARDDESKPYTVRYEAVNAMLLNEFLKEHKAFVTEQHTVASLQAVVAQQQKQIETLTAGLQKVSAQLEMSKTLPQTVLIDQ